MASKKPYGSAPDPKPSVDETDSPEGLLKSIYEAMKGISTDINGADGNSGLRGEVRRVKNQGDRNRKWIAITLVGLCLDLALSVGFFVIAHKIGQQSNSAVVNCRAANKLGESQKTLWGPLLGTDARQPGETDLAYAQRIQFKKTIEELAVPRDCDHPGRVTKTTTPTTTTKQVRK